MKYVYGFIHAEEKTDFGPIGIGSDGEIVYGLPCDGVTAVMSETGDGAIPSLPKAELAERLAQHQAVAEKVMKAGCTILPMKFGAVLDSDAQVAKLLETNREKLGALLDDIEDLFEIEVVAVWPDVQQVFAEIASQKDILELKNRIATLPADESLAARMGLGKLVKNRLDAKKQALQDDILPAWEQVALRAVRHEIRHDAMVINAAFLVDAEARDRLEARVRETDREQGGSLNLRIVGPLPPYSFSTVQLQRAQVTELDAARRELALPERVTPQALADAARSAVRQFHPDTNPSDSHLPEKFERVKAAADMLKRFCPPRGMNLAETEQREFLLVEPLEAL